MTILFVSQLRYGPMPAAGLRAKPLFTRLQALQTYFATVLFKQHT